MHLTLYIAGIPIAEKFSFCLNTLLCDICVKSNQYQDEIIKTQVEVFESLTNKILSVDDEVSLEVKENVCRNTIPVLIGLARSMGRFSSINPPLLNRLFPQHKINVIEPNQAMKKKQSINKKRSFTQFRSIIPRSLSGNFNKTFDLLNNDILDPNKRSSLKSFYSVPYDPTTYFFSKYGSSFNQFPNMRFLESPRKQNLLLFSLSHLQKILDLSKVLLTKDNLKIFDEIALEFYIAHEREKFPYRSFSETINLVIVTLLRELLQNQNDLPAPFTKDVQGFVKDLFLNGQTELQSRNHDASEKEDRENNYATVNKFKINVIANAACVDLLVWAIGDETGKNK